MKGIQIFGTLLVGGVTILVGTYWIAHLIAWIICKISHLPTTESGEQLEFRWLPPDPHDRPWRYCGRHRTRENHRDGQAASTT